MRRIPAYKAGLYGLTENRQLSNSNPKPPFIPVHRTGHSGCFSKKKIPLIANLKHMLMWTCCVLWSSTFYIIPQAAWPHAYSKSNVNFFLESMTTVFAAMSPRRWQFSVKAASKIPTMKLKKPSMNLRRFLTNALPNPQGRRSVPRTLIPNSPFARSTSPFPLK